MKSLISIALALFAFAAVAQPSSPVPKEWWGKRISVQAVEAEERRSRDELISALQKPDLTNSEGKAVDRRTIDRSIEEIRAGSITNRADWIHLKSQIKPGDLLLRFAAPPLSGPMGYVLVRDGVSVDSVVTAEQ